jgi:type II secretion system protein N
LKPALKFFFDIFKYHKLKLFLVSISSTFFLLVLFPSNDLSDLITAKVSEQTRGQIQHLSFADMSFGIFPFGLKLTQVEVQPMGFSTLVAGVVRLNPSIFSAISKTVAGSLNLEKIFGGDAAIDISASDKGPKGNSTANIKVSSIVLSELFKFLRASRHASPVTAEGKLNLQSQLSLNLEKIGVPSGTMNIEIPNLEIPAQEANIGGPVQFPLIRMGKTNANIRLEDNKLVIEDFTFGGSKDDLDGKIKGEVQLMQAGGLFYASNSKLNVSISARESYIESIKTSGISLLFLYIDKCKQTSQGVSTYKFDLNITPGGVPDPQCARKSG